MPSAVNTQVSSIINFASGAFPDGVVGAYAPVQVIVATGSSQATGTAVPEPGSIIVVSAASGTNGVTLPIQPAGTEFAIISSAATNALLLYPPLGGAINFGTVNAAASVGARKLAQLISIDGLGNYALTLSA